MYRNIIDANNSLKSIPEKRKWPPKIVAGSGDLKKELKKRKYKGQKHGLAVNKCHISQKKLTQKSENPRQKVQIIDKVKRAKKAKIKAKKDALAVYKCYTGNNSPKKRKSQAKKKCRWCWGKEKG